MASIFSLCNRGQPAVQEHCSAINKKEVEFIMWSSFCMFFFLVVFSKFI